jgi:dTDP-4-amino-4,6-dideoxygalactose transaminase
MIYCGNPGMAYRAHRAEIDEAVRRVLASGRYVLGPEVSEFEKSFAAYLGTEHAVGVGSGTDALFLALRACGIGRGDEVITVAHTASATVAAIVMSGATPIFADIEPDGFTLDARGLPALLTDRTKAVVPVHLYGQPADMAPILAFAKEHGLRVIEDCAQSAGADYAGRKAGTWGDIGCFSFYPTKNLGAYGDGGLAATRDSVLAERLRRLRQYGWDESRVSREAGVNSRLDELQAAILRVKLRFLDVDNAMRIAHADCYEQTLAGAGLALPARRAGRTHVFHLYVVRSRQQQALLAHLQAHGIQALAHYPVPAHLQPACRPYAPGAGTLAQTERAAKEVVSLPIYPELEAAQQRQVVDAVRSFKAGHD